MCIGAHAGAGHRWAGEGRVRPRRRGRSILVAPAVWTPTTDWARNCSQRVAPVYAKADCGPVRISRRMSPPLCVDLNARSAHRIPSSGVTANGCVMRQFRSPPPRTHAPLAWGVRPRSGAGLTTSTQIDCRPVDEEWGPLWLGCLVMTCCAAKLERSQDVKSGRIALCRSS